MTTVAWDGTTLAADSRATAGSFSFTAMKCSVLADGSLFAASGEGQDCVLVEQWLNAGAPADKKPTGLPNFVAIHVIDGHCYRYEDKLVPMLVPDEFHAVGSGRDFAIAAMALGKTAVEAIKLAARFDVYTDDRVQCVSHEPR